MNWIKYKAIKEFPKRLLTWMPDWMTGRWNEFEKRFQSRYGPSDCTGKILKEKEYICNCYVLLFCIMLFFLAGVGMQYWMQKGNFSSTVQRPNYSDGAEPVRTLVCAEYQGVSIEKNVTVQVKPEELSEQEILQRLERCKEKLEKLILSKNKDRNHVVEPLHLLRKEQETGVTIRWSCNAPTLIDEYGKLNYIRIKKPVWVKLIGILNLEQHEISTSYRVRLCPMQDTTQYKRNLANEIDVVVKEIESNAIGEQAVFPDRGTAGVTLIWKQSQSHSAVWIVLLTILLIGFVFGNRYRRVNGEIRRYREELQRSFPNVVNELVLFLNAGLVVTEAFQRIGEETKEKLGNKNVLKLEIHWLCSRVNQSNSSFSNELLLFAQRCGVREIMRLAVIVNDNLDKGSELSTKLEIESQLLWSNRKKLAEEEGKRIEVKLIMPLVLLLLIVVLITIAPIFLEV